MMRSSIEDPLEEMKKNARMNQEICQRFVRLSCQKMVTSRGCSNLRRNLLILHLLQKARQDMRQVPIECRGLLEQPIQPPPAVTPRSRSSSPIIRRQLRSIQAQQTTPKRWPYAVKRPDTIDTSSLVQQQPPSSTPQPVTPPPVDDSLKTNSFTLAYQALDNDDVFVDEEKENKKVENEDAEELFLRKIGKSFISPPISPEKPVQKLMEVSKEVVNRQSKNNGRRLEFPLPNIRNASGRRDFFGLSDSKLSNEFNSTPPAQFEVEKEQDEMPPYLFNCDEQIKEDKKPVEKCQDRIVPTRLPRNSVSLCLDSNDLKALDNEDNCAFQSDGDYTEEEDEQADFGPRFPSFKRRLRKRKPMAARNINNFLAEKRPKEASNVLMLSDEMGPRKNHNDEHCVPAISI